MIESVKVYQDDDVRARWGWLDRFVKGRWQVAYRARSLWDPVGLWEPETIFGYRDRAKAERRAQKVAARIQRWEDERAERKQRAAQRTAESARIEGL